MEAVEDKEKFTGFVDLRNQHLPPKRRLTSTQGSLSLLLKDEELMSNFIQLKMNKTVV